VRFVVVEGLPGSKIDGACFWLAPDQPVVALSLRLDRIDNFWFVLRHELEHVLRGHGQDAYVIDVDLEATGPEGLPDEERVANEAGAQFCVDRTELLNFIARVQPFFKEERVVAFAQRLQIHPGLVVGQLQRRLGRYDLFRKYQVKVRHLVTATARTDGWGVVHTA
jgi:HTH-type transcriptional regulator/antitoxin HigA